MLAGEPGIGKTRVAREFALHAGQRGALVFWGRCYESAGAPPYWPWVQIVRTYVRDCDAEQLHTAMGAGAADIADMAPEVREHLSDLPLPPRLDDPEQARFRLFDAVTAFLCRVARTSPLVLILDNLHWADKPSLLLLEFLAAELDRSRVLVLGTYRDMELTRHSPLSETLGELTRARPLQRLLLHGLSREEVGHFMVATTGILPPQVLVHTVYTQTEGNSLFLTEVVRLLMQEGAFAPEHLHPSHTSVISIPEGVRAVIGKRLNRLSQPCNQLLTLAAVIGREFGLQEVASLLETWPEESVLAYGRVPGSPMRKRRITTRRPSRRWSCSNRWTRSGAAHCCWRWVRPAAKRASTRRRWKRFCAPPTLPGRGEPWKSWRGRRWALKTRVGALDCRATRPFGFSRNP